MEEAYNHDLLPNGILGLNANYINQYVKYLADRRLEELGFETEYNVSNPAKWMATANDTLQLVNFFESTNTSYEVNATSTSRSEFTTLTSSPVGGDSDGVSSHWHLLGHCVGWPTRVKMESENT
jgi:hypothetical protein